MSGYNIELMRSRILDIADPNNPYTQEDFDKEFSYKKSDTDFYKLPLIFSNKSNNPDPEYATEGSSGFDLRANLTTPIILEAGAYAAIPTGLFFQIPPHMEIQVRSRSGLAAKNGVSVLNSPGTVDSDYRGEVKVILINHGEFKFTINHGDRIAQAVVAPVIVKQVVNFIKTDNILETTERGSGGFGSTGIK